MATAAIRWCCASACGCAGSTRRSSRSPWPIRCLPSLDLYTLGGAEDYAQRLATKHLIRYPGLQQAAARGAPVLAICAAIQVLGHWYETSSGERVDGVGMLDVTTSPQDTRTIGEVVSQPLLPGLSERLTGFENHRGGTVLGSAAQPLARWSAGRATVRAMASTAQCRAASSRRICTGRVWRAIRNSPTTCFPCGRRPGAVGDRRGRAVAQGAPRGAPPRLAINVMQRKCE